MASRFPIDWFGVVGYFVMQYASTSLGPAKYNRPCRGAATVLTLTDAAREGVALWLMVMHSLRTDDARDPGIGRD